MRVTLELDEDLVRAAKEITGIAESGVLLHEALKALVERESVRKLVALGGTTPRMKTIPRRRSRPPGAKARPHTGLKPHS